ncbi:MAG: hypothetical protein HYU67_13840, partial [Flavobacteriia bacterium]|nr:hypothetical protein [Flavobacteriia bacterium]
MLHHIFALFVVLLSHFSIFTGFPQSKSSQNCSAILESISKDSKDKKEKIKEDLDKITVFIPTKEFYKKKLLDQAQDNVLPIPTPQALEEDDDEDDEIDQITKISQKTLPANFSYLKINNNAGISVNPDYGIGIIAQEEQQTKKKTQLDVNLNLALHLDFDKNLELIYSKHKDFCKDKEIIPDKDTSTDNAYFINTKTLLDVCAAAVIGYVIIKTAPV